MVCLFHLLGLFSLVYHLDIPWRYHPPKTNKVNPRLSSESRWIQTVLGVNYLLLFFKFVHIGFNGIPSQMNLDRMASSERCLTLVCCCKNKVIHHTNTYIIYYFVLYISFERKLRNFGSLLSWRIWVCEPFKKMECSQGKETTQPADLEWQVRNEKSEKERCIHLPNSMVH